MAFDPPLLGFQKPTAVRHDGPVERPSLEPKVVWMPGKVRTEVHLTGTETGGALCMLVDEPPAGWSLPPHRHRREAEIIFVVDGTFEVQVDGTWHDLRVGQSIHIPAGTLHAGRGSGRRVVLFSPAGLEEFFLRLGTAGPDAAHDPREAVRVAIEHGWDFDGAPRLAG